MRPLSPPPWLQASAVAKNQNLLNPTLSSTTATATCSPHTCKWKPYSNSKDFEANAILVLIILFCALTCALALNAAIRCFLRDNNGRQQRSPNRAPQQQSKPTAEVAAASLVTAPILVYSSGMKLTGTEAECVICLSEFVEGDVIQVLARCNHGFHMKCIQQWLSSHDSCPTCRRSCLTSTSPSSNGTNSTQHDINQSSQLPGSETHSGSS